MTTTTAIYRYDLTVPAAAIDENGHLNNVEYVRWMQVAAIAHTQHTAGDTETTKAGATWVARSHRIEYLKPAFEGEQLALFTWISSTRRVRAQRKYIFFRPADQATIATGETEWIFADVKTGRPRSIPPAVAAVFEVISDEDLPPVESL